MLISYILYSNVYTLKISILFLDKGNKGKFKLLL